MENVMKITFFVLIALLALSHELEAAYLAGSINYEPMVGAIPGWYLQYPPMQSSIRAKNYRSKHCGPSAGCERGCTEEQQDCRAVERVCEADDIVNDDCPEYW